MSDSDLPDDPTRWPTDPFALLGVDREVDRRELRRAYTRLIRRFKPEHFPAQFRRIRDAYESLEQYLQYREHFSPEAPCDDEPAAEPEVIPPGAAEEKSDEASPAPSAPPAPRVPVDPVTAAWQQAVAGQTPEAYRQLRAVAQRGASDPALYARLYWLLVLHPQLDTQCDRREWLTAGLLATRFDGRLAELYERELQADPEEVIRPRCRKVLACRQPVAKWARFAARCWGFAGLLRRWQSIAQDLQAAREEATQAGRSLWARLLLAGAEQFLWQDDPRANQQLAHACRRELDEFAEEHQELSYELDRCDYLVELTAGWRKLTAAKQFRPGFVEALRDVLRRSWVQPFPVIQPALLVLLRPMVDNPRRALADLDRVAQLSSPVLYQFHGLVDALYRQRHGFAENAGSDQLLAATDTFFRTHDWGVYDRVRPSILFHCLASRITLDEFEAAAARLPLPLAKSGLTERLRHDLPLRNLAAACLAFWS